MSDEPEILEVLPDEVRPGDILGEGRYVHTVNHNLHPRRSVELEVATAEVVLEDYDGTALKRLGYRNGEVVQFFNNYETGDMALERPIRVVRGVSPDTFPIRMDPA